MDNIMDENNKKQKKPKKTPRIKHKKLIILFTAILVVATVFIIKMFNTKHYALADETESFEIERPTSGNPMDYSGKDNAAICNWVIKHTNEFKSVTTGTVKAKVAVISYNQDIHNTRIVTTDGCYIETISDSSLVHVYEEKYLENKQVVVRKNHSDKYTTITNDVFLEKYGWHPKDFQAYILNEDTILEATVEPFEENYKLTLILDPVKSAPRKQRETKTVGNASDYPGYKTTELTVILTSDWTPIEVDTYEVYDIAMPGLGSITCKCNMVEIIEYGKFDIPDKDLFKEHISDEIGDIDDTEKDVIGYLQEIFGPLVQGQMNDFKLNVEALDTKLEGDLKINLGLSGVKVNANIDDIFVSYQGDDVYVKLGENKYKVNINKLKQALGNDLNTNALDLNSIIDQVNDSQIIKNGNKVTIKMNLDLMGIKATVNINATLDGNVYKFDDVDAIVNIKGKDIKLKMTKASSKNKYPNTDSSYQDITDISFMVDEVKALIDKPLEINLATTINDIDIKANAIYKNGLISGLITINDKYDINVYYNNDTVYLTFKDLYFKLNINDISEYTKDINLGDIKINLRDILDIVKTLNIKMLGAKSFDLSVDLSKYTDLLNDARIKISKTDSLNVEIEKYNLLFSVKPTELEVEANPDVEYNDLADLGWLIDIVKEAIDYEAYNFNIDLAYEDLKVKGNIYLDKDLNVSANLDVVYKEYEFKDIKLNYIDKTIYVEAFNIKASMTVDDILSLVKDTDTTEFDIDKLIENITLSLTDSNISLGVDLSTFDGIFNKFGLVNLLVNNEKEVVINSDLIKANVKLTNADKQTITINADEYIKFNDINWLVDMIKEVIEYDAYNFNIDLSYEDLNIKGIVYLDKDLYVSAVVDLTYKDYVIKNIKVEYVDNNIYLSLYNVKVKATIEEIMSLVGEKIEIDIISLLNNFTLEAIDNSVSMGLNLNSFDGLLNKFGIINLMVNEAKEVNLDSSLISGTIKLSSSTIKTKTINDSDYIDIANLEWLIDDIKEAIEYEAYSFTINLEYKDLKVNGSIYLNKDLEVEANLDINYAGVLFNGIKLMYNNKDVFVKYANTTIKLNLDDIPGIISEINRVFDLDIKEELALDLDIDSILSGITLSSLDELFVINANLDSIIDTLGNVKVEISKGLKVKVSNTDITLNAALSSTEYKEIVLPAASINKDEIYLLIEYVYQLKEIVEKWRYNIGFELHVNGYDIYAKVNIITFKPNAGLSLYGKLVIFKGSNEYYAEASIIDNEAYLNFSQTITNKNKTNPINSTTSQSIKFRISFDELIDVANYAIDKLGIDNDTIKMAITYLGKIVNTNGDFDDLFTEISGKVKSLDLSMLNDFIDLSQIGLFVDSDNLTIDFGTNSLGKNHSISIYREDGQIKGLNTVDFEINNDILNSHFELLADENISAANYSGCLNFNGVGDLIKSVVDNYKHGEIAISGKVSMSLLGLNLSASVTIDAKLDFDYNGKIRGYIGLDIKKLGIDFLGLLIKNDTKTYIYIQDDMIYMKRTINSTSTRKMSLSDFGKDIKEQIVWIFNFGSTVADQIINAEPVDVKIEEVLTAYSGKNNSYSVTLDGAKLVGSNAFNDINLTLTTTKTNDELYLSSIKAEATLISILDISAPLTVASITSPIDWNSFFPSEATLNGFTTYNIN